MLFIAHRGLHGDEIPENSRAAFRQAAKSSVDGVELDVHETIDGQFIVFHDRSLDRMTDMSGPIKALSYGQLVQANLGNDESIPLLSEVLDILQTVPLINLDIKGTKNTKNLAYLLGTCGIDHRKLHITTPDKRLQKLLNTALPEARIGSIVALWPLRSLNGLRSIWSQEVTFVSLPLKLTHSWIIKRLHACGKKVFVFTVNNPAESERMDRLGVDAIFTDTLI